MPALQLQVRVIEARNLATRRPDGLANPYVIITTLSASRTEVKTKIVDNTINPQFNAQFVLELKSPTDRLLFRVKDCGNEENDRLGEVLVTDLAHLAEHEETVGWLKLENAISGEIKVGLMALNFGKKKNVRASATVPTHVDSSSNAKVSSPKVETRKEKKERKAKEKKAKKEKKKEKKKKQESQSNMIYDTVGNFDNLSALCMAPEPSGPPSYDDSAPRSSLMLSGPLSPSPASSSGAFAPLTNAREGEQFRGGSSSDSTSECDSADDDDRKRNGEDSDDDEESNDSDEDTRPSHKFSVPRLAHSAPTQHQKNNKIQLPPSPAARQASPRQPNGADSSPAIGQDLICQLCNSKGHVARACNIYLDLLDISARYKALVHVQSQARAFAQVQAQAQLHAHAQQLQAHPQIQQHMLSQGQAVSALVSPRSAEALSPHIRRSTGEISPSSAAAAAAAQYRKSSIEPSKSPRDVARVQNGGSQSPHLRQRLSSAPSSPSAVVHSPKQQVIAALSLPSSIMKKSPHTFTVKSDVPLSQLRKPLGDLRRELATWALQYLRVLKMCFSQEQYSSQQFIRNAITRYQQFLPLKKKSGELQLYMPEDVLCISVLHTAHPLDYTRACMEVFGSVKEISDIGTQNQQYQGETGVVWSQRNKQEIMALGVDLQEAAAQELRFFLKLREEQLTTEWLDSATEEYLQYMIAYKNQVASGQTAPTVPTLAVETIWRGHMMHPVHYHNDCMQLVGVIVDHNCSVIPHVIKNHMAQKSPASVDVTYG